MAHGSRELGQGRQEPSTINNRLINELSDYNFIGIKSANVLKFQGFKVSSSQILRFSDSPFLEFSNVQIPKFQ